VPKPGPPRSRSNRSATSPHASDWQVRTGDTILGTDTPSPSLSAPGSCPSSSTSTTGYTAALLTAAGVLFTRRDA
jgi:hypothetical protein